MLHDIARRWKARLHPLVLPADEKYLDAVKAYLDIDVFADAMIEGCSIQGTLPLEAAL